MALDPGMTSPERSIKNVAPQLQAPELKEMGGILRRHAKSFSFAGLFLPSKNLKKAELIYAFCRWVDDVADESGSELEARQELQAISQELLGQTAARFFVREFKIAASDMGLDLQIPEYLIRGVLSDLGAVNLQSEEQLHQYCYHVAATVGLMMCAVLDVRNPVAFPFAIDLGIAMQMTNIARDVDEDRKKGRNYLPHQDWSEAKRISLVLSEADLYYESAFHGLTFIPWATRFAICVAAVVYRAIGHKIRARGFAMLGQRASIPLGQKIWLVVTRAVPLFISTLWSRKHEHQVHLHRHLLGYPGVNV